MASSLSLHRFLYNLYPVMLAPFDRGIDHTTAIDVADSENARGLAGWLGARAVNNNNTDVWKI
jgi:hypothetical protein